MYALFMEELLTRLLLYIFKYNRPVKEIRDKTIKNNNIDDKINNIYCILVCLLSK